MHMSDQPDGHVRSHDAHVRSHDHSCRLLGAYERMELPSLQKMDANGTREEVLGAVYKVIQGKLGASL